MAQSVATTTPNAPQLTDDTAANALIWLNFRRQQAGLAALTRTSTLDKGAKAHSEYQKTNNVVSHEEDPNLSGFTGVTDFDRMKAAGYPFPDAAYAYGEVISFTNDELGENAVEALFGAIYHRFVMLEPKYTDVGLGSASTKIQDTYLTADLGTLDLTLGGLGDGKMIVYPFDGQTAVPVKVDSDEEEPDPSPDTNLIGYPISVHADLTQNITVQTFSVTPHGSGTPLSVRLLTSGTDAETHSYQAAIIPLSPLVAGTTYDAHFVGSIGPTPSELTAVDRTWSFTTAP